MENDIEKNKGEENKEEENKTIVKFNPAIEEIKKLVEETKKITIKNIDNIPIYISVKDYLKKLADMRIAIQKCGKKKRDEALKFQKKVIQLEKEILAEIEPEETRLRNLIILYDAEKIMLERRKTLPMRTAALKNTGITEINEQYILSLDNIEFATYFNNKKKEVAETEAKKQAEIDLAAKREAEILLRIAKEREQAVLNEKRRAETEKAEIENKKAETEKKIAEERKREEANEKFLSWKTENKYNENNKEMFITTTKTGNETKYEMFKKISEIII